MNKKKIFAVILTTILAFNSTSLVFAKDKVINFQGEAKKFITEDGGDLGEEGFENMDPGEQRTQTVTLKNSDYQEMKFYMSAEILSNIADQGDQQAVYTLNINKNNQTFFSTVIGSEENAVGKEYLDKDNNILLASLKKGESTQIEVVIELDGDSTENAYQNKTGQIQLNFHVEVAEKEEAKVVKEVITKTNTTTEPQNAATKKKLVKTGDDLPVGMMLAVAGMSLVIIIGTIAVKKKKDAEEKS